jgi:hypothetical protein
MQSEQAQTAFTRNCAEIGLGRCILCATGNTPAYCRKDPGVRFDNPVRKVLERPKAVIKPELNR